MSNYDTAQVCLNGHLICTSMEQCPDDAQKFCSKCGVATITNCPSCQSILRGYCDSDYIKPVTVESYCFNCGKSYPWIETAIETTKLIIQEDEELGGQQKTTLIESLPDIIVEAPKPTWHCCVFKKYLILQVNLHLML